MNYRKADIKDVNQLVELRKKNQVCIHDIMWI